MSDILQVQGINEKGFGTIPKLVMQDKQLTVEAKGIYSYFCSYAGAGKTAFPSRNKIISDLGISEKRYYRHFKLLTENGYIKVEQEKNNTGQFTRNIYTLMQVIPCSQNDCTEKNTQPYSRFPHTDKAHTQNDRTNNNIFKNKQSFKNISQSSPSVKEDRRDKTDRNTINRCTEVFKDNIGYEDFEIAHASDLSLVDEIILIMADVMITAEPYIRIRGENKPIEAVKSVLMRLTYEDVEHVIWQFKGVTERIRKKRQYLLTMLYNAPMEKYSQLTNEYESNRWK